MNDSILEHFRSVYGRYPTASELKSIEEKLRSSNVRSVAQIGSVIAGLASGGILPALGAAILAKPIYDTAKDLPIVGDVLGVLEDIFG